MGALIVFESLFGNGRAVARAVATGLSSRMPVEVVAVEDAPTVFDPGLDLLVVGGPNHRFGLSSDSSRGEGAATSDTPVTVPGSGLREWLPQLAAAPGRTQAAVYDTRLANPRFLDWVDHASTSIVRHLRRAGFRMLAPAEHFYVSAGTGPLVEGEIECAQAWGEGLAAQLPAAQRP
ncbi:MAG TPA: hypothetical protein VK875_11435 [Euzebyales bacterium]|nr:hypothetical protein [Euzebyales bacterium]